jgi:hypothetical protein
VNSNRDLMPYLLLALLFVATELGIALGASQAPETHTAAVSASASTSASAATSDARCTDSLLESTCVSQGSSTTVWFSPSGVKLPTGIDTCLKKELEELPKGVPSTGNEAVIQKDLKMVLATCEGQQ